MKLIFEVKDAKHDKSAGLDIKKEAKLNQVTEDTIITDIQHQFWEFAQSWELNCHLANVEEGSKSNKVNITEQDKKDIKQTILWLNEAAEWIDNMGGAEIDGEPKWNDNVKDSINVACEWLCRMTEKGNENVK